jgi:hypothetical protein
MNHNLPQRKHAMMINEPNPRQNFDKNTGNNGRGHNIEAGFI